MALYVARYLFAIVTFRASSLRRHGGWHWSFNMDSGAARNSKITLQHKHTPILGQFIVDVTRAERRFVVRTVLYTVYTERVHTFTLYSVYTYSTYLHTVQYSTSVQYKCCIVVKLLYEYTGNASKAISPTIHCDTIHRDNSSLRHYPSVA